MTGRMSLACVEDRCAEPVVVLVLSDIGEQTPYTYAACATHAAVVVHEEAASAAPEDYLVVNLTAEARLNQVRRYAQMMLDSMSVTRWEVAKDVLSIVDGQVGS